MDPSVLLKQQGVQWSDPLEDYTRLRTLRDLMDQRRIREQQYQLQQQAMQEHARKAQQEIEDRARMERVRGLFAQNARPSFQQMAEVDPATAFKLSTDQRLMETAERTAEEAKLKLGKGRAASLSDLMASNRLLPADQRQENWDAAWGGIPVDLAPSEAQAQAQEVLGYGQKEQEARQAAKNKATQDALLFGPQFLKARMDAQKAQTEVLEGKPSTGTLAEFESAFYPGWLAAKGLPKSAENQYKAYLEWQEGRRPRIAVPGTDVPLSPAVAQQKIDIANATKQAGTAQYGAASTLTGEEFLNTLKPGQAALIKAIAEGRESLAGRSSKDVIALKQAVQQYDPQFSDQRAAVRKAFTTGKEGQNLGAINTAIVHLGRLAHASEALKNGSFTPANEMYQYFRDKFGSASVTNFGLLKDAVAGEMAAALKGTATDIEIANMKTSIRGANSPAQMLGVVKEGMGILSDKAKTYDDRYHQQMPDDQWSPILPTAKDSLQRFGVPYSGSARGGAKATVKMRAPNGDISDVPADQVKHYESRGAKKVEP